MAISSNLSTNTPQDLYPTFEKPYWQNGMQGVFKINLLA
jgi:hypothetical protein